ncbi:FKBP-type peptidyl-prolyl cis-trans isomerase [Planomonospora sp. ID67723]|uniref:FKBP-type peptidyl-prolyl cis-trans isomerase n=1 Tax=Planomonospora sp. ID67723 TaxID=2738134 RepID=UPI0018C37B5F|nr:FKBP-type peptidyl-prolyl cis-trans isomerase [Planomonospora sp. ID67723]MBG0833058.1 FKBP-type peptidyl-prolyl cis-trans isomerase [Planomonospora sp. ID67723]
MRRRSLAVLAAVPLLFAVACGTEEPDRPAGGSGLKVTGEIGKKPSVVFPSGAPATKSSEETVKDGSGTEFKIGDSVLVNYTVFTWDGKTNAPVGSTYDAGNPETIAVSEQLPSVLKDVFVGAKPGGRHLAVVAPDSLTKEQLETAKQQGQDKLTQVFVLDMVGLEPKAPKPVTVEGKAVDPGVKGITVKNPEAGKAPTLTTKTGEKAPKELVSKVVIKGTGPVVKSGQKLMAHYIGKIWGTDKQFDSSWDRGEPATFGIGVGQVIKGWDDTLVGLPVGTRVLLSIPPDLGYGAEGRAPDIKGTDTLVFLVDIVGAY